MNNQPINFFDPFKIEDVEIYPENMDLPYLHPIVQAKRINYQGNRFYYYIIQGPEGLVVSPLFPSVTTMTKDGRRQNWALNKWYAEQGWEGSLKILNDKRAYGTFDHIAKAELSAKVLESGSQSADFAVSDLRLAFDSYRKDLGLPMTWGYEFFDKLCRSLQSWRRFFMLFDVEPILIEKTLFHFDEDNPQNNYAGTLDLAFYATMGDRYKSGANKWSLKPEKDTKV